MRSSVLHPYRLLAFLGVKTAHTGMISTGFSARLASDGPLDRLADQCSPDHGVFTVFVFVLPELRPVLLVSCIAFWLAEIGFLFEAVRIVFIALSGGIFPLAVLGPAPKRCSTDALSLHDQFSGRCAEWTDQRKRLLDRPPGPVSLDRRALRRGCLDLARWFAQIRRGWRLSMMARSRKHLRVWLFFMRTSLAAQLEYRANFLTGVAMEVGYLLVKLMYVFVVYQAGVTINGLTPDEILLFSGVLRPDDRRLRRPDHAQPIRAAQHHPRRFAGPVHHQADFAAVYGDVAAQ